MTEKSTFPNRLNSFLTSLIGVFSQRKALEMDMARQNRTAFLEMRGEHDHYGNLLRTYEAVVTNRATSRVNITDDTANKELILSNALGTLRKIARHYTKNSIFGKAIKNAVIAHSIGDKITFQSKATTPSGKGNEKVRKQIEAFWNQYTTELDATGKKSLIDFCSQGMGQLIETGEYFINKVIKEKEGHLIPLKFQSIDSDLIDLQLNQQDKDKNRIIGGIEIDEFGEPVSYQILNEGNVPFSVISPILKNHQTVTAENIIHAFKEDRPGQLRGEPWITAGLKPLQQIHAAVDSELFTLQIQAMLAVVYSSGTGGSDKFMGSETANATNSAGNTLRNLSPGALIEIPKTDNIKIIDPARPGNMFVPFVKFIMGGIGASIGFSYAKIMKDYSDGNFSSQRQSNQDDQRHIKPIQGFVVKEIVHPIFSSAIDMAVITGRLPLPNYSERRNEYLKGFFTFTPEKYIDPLKDVSAEREALKMGMTTLTKFYADRGIDIEDVIEEIRKEKELFEKAGITLNGEDSEASIKKTMEKILMEQKDD